VHGLSAVLYAVATHPDQWARPVADPSLARVALDEAVRWKSPVHTFFRTTTTGVRIGDAVVPAGRMVLMFLSAANRDPRRWIDPDRFDLFRTRGAQAGLPDRPSARSSPSARASNAACWKARMDGTVAWSRSSAAWYMPGSTRRRTGTPTSASRRA
jgi:Cytochrome P450